MKMQIAAICYNERELEIYVTQLQSQGFESLGEVKKAEDGSWYQVMARLSKFEMPLQEKVILQPAENLTA